MFFSFSLISVIERVNKVSKHFRFWFFKLLFWSFHFSFFWKRRCTDFTIDADSKWRSLFSECLSQLGCDSDDNSTDIAISSYDVSPELAWKGVYNHVLKAAGSMSTVLNNSSARIDIEFIRNDEYKDKMKLAHNLKGLRDFLSQVKYRSLLHVHKNTFYIFFVFLTDD